MDQCSQARHPISATATLTNQPGHDLTPGIHTSQVVMTMLSGQRLGNQPHPTQYQPVEATPVTWVYPVIGVSGVVDQ
jgi:hypothetical protein